MIVGPGLQVGVRGVSRTFVARGVLPVQAIDGVTLEVRSGERVTLTGRSGSGKTTLLGLLGGLLPPTSGRVLVDGADLASLTRSQRTALARSIGIVPQSALLIRGLPAWENVAYALVPLGVPPAERRDLALAALERVNLVDLASRRPEGLSGGERRRIVLARAVLVPPRLLLADEPTSNLDPESANVVSELLASVHAAGCTVIVASHDPRLLEEGRTVHMTGGRVQESARV